VIVVNYYSGNSHWERRRGVAQARESRGRSLSFIVAYFLVLTTGLIKFSSPMVDGV